MKMTVEQYNSELIEVSDLIMDLKTQLVLAECKRDQIIYERNRAIKEVSAND